jgi:ketosteroid isomerase-like protein
MASANVELVRSILRAWEGGDFGSADWAAPEIEFVFADGPIPGTYEGLSAMADANRDWLQAWDELRQIPDAFRELDHERVLVLHHWHARGKRSGLQAAEMRGESAAIFQIRDGKVTRLVHYFDRERALEAVGLKE